MVHKKCLKCKAPDWIGVDYLQLCGKKVLENVGQKYDSGHKNEKHNDGENIVKKILQKVSTGYFKAAELHNEEIQNCYLRHMGGCVGLRVCVYITIFQQKRH